MFPETREQRCWFHKITNVLNALPTSAQPGAKAALAEIWNAEDRAHAEAAANAFAADFPQRLDLRAARLQLVPPPRAIALTIARRERTNSGPGD